LLKEKSAPEAFKENDYEKNYLVINPASKTDLYLVNVSMCEMFTYKLQIVVKKILLFCIYLIILLIINCKNTKKERRKIHFDIKKYLQNK
jgi:response regulator RpfG family c-di-GMP phosphodiesterase